MTKDDAKIFKLWENAEKHQSTPVKDAQGNVQWWRNGVRHREDGPAIEYVDGTKEWLQHGVHHREDGPAIEYADGAKEWIVKNVRHREDGPAMIWNGGEAWFIDNRRYTNVYDWAKAALKWQGNLNPSEDDVADKVAQVMQVDLFD